MLGRAFSFYPPILLGSFLWSCYIYSCMVLGNFCSIYCTCVFLRTFYIVWLSCNILILPLDISSFLFPLTILSLAGVVPLLVILVGLVFRIVVVSCPLFVLFPASFPLAEVLLSALFLVRFRTSLGIALLLHLAFR